MDQKLPPQDFFTENEIQKFHNETSGTKKVIHLNNAGWTNAGYCYKESNRSP